MIIKMLEECDIVNAHTLIMKTFNKCCTPEISLEGRNCFYEGNTIELFISGYQNGKIKIWGCFDGEKMCAVAQLQSPNHLVNLFVDEGYQNRGVGKMLFYTVVAYCKNVQYIQLEALSSSVEFCKHLGCIAIDEKRTFRELEYLPMIYKL